jgi:kanamycin kinase
MYRLTSADGEIRYLKITRNGWTPSAEAEAQRLRWAAHRLPVPKLLDAGATEEVTWLITAGLTGRDATHPSFHSDVRALVTTLAQGLRAFHEIPRRGCSFSFRIDDALRVARDRLEAGRIDHARDFHVEHAHLTAEEAVAELMRTSPPTEDLVVCHGDYCLPNILIDHGKITGYVDLGELGIADRWWDLAVGSWSVTWNLGPGLETHFLAAYGVAPDEERMAFYRLLYDVVS